MNVNATGIALASVFAIGALLYVIALNVGHMWDETVHMLKQFHMSTGRGFGSGVINVVEHAVYGYVIGIFFAWVYNMVASCKKCCGSSCSTESK